jgi:hypothetical protein|uniref:Lactamase n=1 Tax=Siphoviridae sp. ctqw35 TaxID=2826471 RepID=A0A8S5LZC5_9CAUD|nr:MAG TPA: lactamase [Siphoviridae sp. ctqw35]
MSNHEEEKKPVYKKWWFWLIVVIIVIAIVGGTQTSTNNTQTSSSVNESEVQTTENEKTTTKDVKVTLEQYNQIKDGMTYEEVVEIFGGKESTSSESEIAGIKSEIKTWNGNGTFSVATIGFTDGEVSSKSQTGLE